MRALAETADERGHGGGVEVRWESSLHLSEPFCSRHESNLQVSLTVVKRKSSGLSALCLYSTGEFIVTFSYRTGTCSLRLNIIKAKQEKFQPEETQSNTLFTR